MSVVPIARLLPEFCDSCVYHDPNCPDPRPCSVDDTEFVGELSLSGADILCGLYYNTNDLP